MKKLFKIILSALIFIPLSACLTACGGKAPANNSDKNQNVEQIFSKFEIVQKNMESYNESLSIEQNNAYYNCPSKDLMNTEGYWPETSSNSRGYNHETGDFFSIEERWEYFEPVYFSKVFDDKIGFFPANQNSVLVDKEYGKYKIKEDIIIPGETNNTIYNMFSEFDFHSYKACTYTFEERKKNDKINSDLIEANYSIDAKREDNIYIIEATYNAKRRDGLNLMDENNNYTFKFNDSFLISFTKVSERFFQSHTGDYTQYHCGENYYTFSYEFNEDKFAEIDRSSQKVPNQKLQQVVNIYRNDQFFGGYSLEFGSPISDLLNFSPLENSTGYIAYLDANHTQVLTNEVVKSYEPANAYLISIPEKNYSTIITKYICEKASGERVVSKIEASIQKTLDDSWPEHPQKYTTFYPERYLKGQKYYYEDVYVNGEKIEYSYDVYVDTICYIEYVHKQDTSPVSINLYDNTTGKLWKTLTTFEKGMVWSYVNAEILTNSNYNNYCGWSLKGFSVNFALKDQSGKLYDNTIINGDLNLTFTVNPPLLSNGNLFKYINLENDGCVDSLDYYNYANGDQNVKTFSLEDYDTFIINDCIVKIDGVMDASSLSECLPYYKYELSNQYNTLKIKLTGGSYVIKYKLSSQEV